MNAVEIEAAVSELAKAPFNVAEFPYAFLAAFGNKKTTIAPLRKGATNKSDLPGGILQRNNVHLAVSKSGRVNATFNARLSLETAKAKELASGETLACDYSAFPGHFDFFLPLAGISTIKKIEDSASLINKLAANFKTSPQ